MPCGIGRSHCLIGCAIEAAARYFAGNARRALGWRRAVADIFRDRRGWSAAPANVLQCRLSQLTGFQSSPAIPFAMSEPQGGGCDRPFFAGQCRVYANPRGPGLTMPA